MNQSRKTLCLLLLALDFASASATVLQGNADTFVLTAESLEPYVPGYLGNGYFSMVTSQLGTAPTRSYMIKLYDHAADDVPRIAALPAWNEVNFFNGRNWLNDTALEKDRLRSYRQSLNMYDGSLKTSYQWVEDNRATSIEVESFVSRSNPHLAVVKFQMTPHYSGSVQVSLPIRPSKAPHRIPLARIESWKAVGEAAKQAGTTSSYPGHMVVRDQSAKLSKAGGILEVISQADGGTTAVAEIAAVAWPKDLPGLTTNGVVSDELVSIELRFTASADRSYVFYKYIGVVPSFQTPGYVQSARETAEDARARGYSSIFAEHAAAWHDLWKTDVVVEDDSELQTAIHSNLFYLLSSVRAGTEFNIPPMGLSNRSFNGHVFCDAEALMFPTLLALHPEMAKSLVMFRYRTLEAAMLNAQLNGYKGAKYPWEADELGMESTPRGSLAGALEEIVVNGEVALAQWQYYLATGDRDFLASYGYPVIKQVADFWLSRATYSQKNDRYEIKKVLGNEGIPFVNNDTYINGIARKTLECALTASRLLGQPENPQWSKVASKIYIPYDAANQVYPAYDGAPLAKPRIDFQIVSLSYPLELSMTATAKRNTFENALKSIAETDTDGMGFIYQHYYPIVAAELGDSKRIDEWLPANYKRHLRPPFNMFIENYRGGLESVVFLTAAGGFLQQFIYGYSGLRWSEDGLVQKFKPILPTHLKKLTLKNITIRGNKCDVVVENGKLQRITQPEQSR